MPPSPLSAAVSAPVAATTVPAADEPVSTVAAAEPGPDGDYSSEAAVQTLRPWVDAAREAGVYGPTPPVFIFYQ